MEKENGKSLMHKLSLSLSSPACFFCYYYLKV